MDVQRQIEYWLNGSLEDIDAAAVLIEKGKFRQGMFFAHLAVEKALKAHVTKATGDVPPRTHDLLRLSDMTSIALTERQRTFLSRLQRYCLEGRYPDLQPAAPSGEPSQADLLEARETRSWLASQLT